MDKKIKVAIRFIKLSTEMNPRDANILLKFVVDLLKVIIKKNRIKIKIERS